MHDATGNQSDHFDLLPFIAILMCVLGCLLLVTISMSAISMGVGAGEAWVPATAPNDTSKQPVLVEWDGVSAVVHHEHRRARIAWTPPEAREVWIGGSKFRDTTYTRDVPAELMREVEWLAERKGTHYLLVVVRPSGFGTLEELALLYSSKGISIGYEPLEEGRSVQLRAGGEGESSPARAAATRAGSQPSSARGPSNEPPSA